MAIDWRRERSGGPAAHSTSPRPTPLAAAPAAAASARVAAPPRQPWRRFELPPRPSLETLVPQLVRRAAWITLAVTLLRLSGEKLDGAVELFGRGSAGGDLAWVGIVWLVPVVGFVFGWRLYTRGLQPPAPRRALGLPAAALLLPFALVWLVGRVHPLNWTERLAAWGVVSLVSAVMAGLAWPALGRQLVAYALLARLPVVILMGVAMRFEWGTHYDALPPDFPSSMSLLQRWFWLGVVPQSTIWVAFTLAVGTAFGVLGWHAARYRDA